MEQRLRELANDLRPVIPADMLEGFEREIGYGEYGLGVENLCEQMYEAEVRLPRPIIDEIAGAARAMDLPPQRWDMVFALEVRPNDRENGS